jgi:rieske iron-sulfur protein
MRACSDRCTPCYGRRAVLGTLLGPILGPVLGQVLGLALAPLGVSLARAEDEAAKPEAARPPQPDDHFVFLTGPNKGQVVKVDNLAVGGPQVQVYPVGPDGTVRNETPLNLVILARFDPAALSEETRGRAAEGVVAYSAVCTHQACPVNMWSKDHDAFVCSCHGSVFDPKKGAEVIGGPAPRPLPSLGLKIADGAVVVASGFSSRVGGTQK